MKAKLIEIYTLESYEKLENFKPGDNENFGVWIRMIVGEEYLDGEESFDIMICTPKWLINTYKKNDILFLKHHVIVFEYSFNRIKSALKNEIESIEAESWREIGNRIARIGKWEFEDYKE